MTAWMKVASVLWCALLPCAASAADDKPPETQEAKPKHVVVIEEAKFVPETIEVAVGATVTWTNNDDREHTVMADDGAFSSGRLPVGRSFSHQFTRPGRYPYKDELHPRMKGTVIVREAEKPRG